MSDDQTPAEEFNEVADAAADELLALRAENQALKDQVLRVVHSSCNNGFDKLFISGRMADVCAELDRLAARETLA